MKDPYDGAGPFGGNHILRSLSGETLSRIRPHLSRVTLVKSQVLFEIGATLENVYFLESGLTMLVADTGDNGRVQVGMVGAEGFAGSVSVFDGDLTSLHQSVVQYEGTAYRMPQHRFQEAFATFADLESLCLRHTKALMLQISQSCACNARHTVSQRLCRLILMVQDRVGSARLSFTQEDFALMLGVRRAGVSAVVSGLEAAGTVRQSRGRLEIEDRASIKACACVCYGIIRNGQAGLTGPLAREVSMQPLPPSCHGRPGVPE